MYLRERGGGGGVRGQCVVLGTTGAALVGMLMVLGSFHCFGITCESANFVSMLLFVGSGRTFVVLLPLRLSDVAAHEAASMIPKLRCFLAQFRLLGRVS